MNANACQVTSSGIALSGPVTYDTVVSLYETASAILDSYNGHAFTACFDAVDQVDSAALTFMLSCVRLAASKGISVSFQSVPIGLYDIAQIGGVSELLRLEKVDD